MATGRPILPAFGTRRARLAMTLAAVALLATLPVLVARVAQGWSPTRTALVDLRESGGFPAPTLTRLRQERRRTGTLVVVLRPGAVTRVCSAADTTDFCTGAGQFPVVFFTRAENASAAAAHLYGGEPDLVSVGSGVYEVTHTTGTGLIPAVIVAVLLALGIAFLLLAPLQPANGPPPVRPQPRVPPPAPRKPPRRVAEVWEFPAVGDEVVCRSPFGAAGGYVCFGGAVVLWAEMASPFAAAPGDPLTVVGVDPSTARLRVAAFGSPRHQ